MLFNSLHFVAFFIITTIVYFLLPHRYRWFLLLSISCYFYMAFIPIYILILGFTIVIDYIAGILIEQSERNKKHLLAMSIVANVGVLCFFKYYNFLNENLTTLLGLASFKNPIPALNIILPIGLSFHTFQAMSYTIEVYRGNQKAEKHLGIYALYVMFYPQLVAGPIERPQNVLHQFYKKVTFDYERVVEGLKLMLWGLFKKIVIADRLAIYVDAVYNNPQHHSGISSAVATVFFAFQIYCDFSGYSTIAIGAAKVLGIDLMENFRRPYLAKSIKEFWSRWHISLSTWFRDYLYIPIGGSRVKFPKYIRNILIVFIISGIWHGASWTFVIWGALHGFYQITEVLLNKYVYKDKPRSKAVTVLNYITTFVLVCLAWVFFRANTVQDGFTIISNILTFKKGGLFIGFAAGLVYSVLLIIFLIITEINYEYFNNKFSLIYSKRPVVREVGYVLLLLTILIIGVFNGGQFIYFQF
ncbi:MAG: MBOAT family protein [Chitinophagales bacterium]|nr:MBOAT family protein [Chitinophagales bacterium]